MEVVPWILEVDWVFLCAEEKQLDEKYKIPGFRVNMVYTVMPHDTVLSPSVFFRMCNIRKKRDLHVFLENVYWLIRTLYAPSHLVSHTGGCKVPNSMPSISIWLRFHSIIMHLITSKLGVIVYSLFSQIK